MISLEFTRLEPRGSECHSQLKNTQPRTLAGKGHGRISSPKEHSLLSFAAAILKISSAVSLLLVQMNGKRLG